MKIFILTASINDVVEEIDVYDTFAEAEARGDEIGAELGLVKPAGVPAFTPQMNGWIIFDAKPTRENEYVSAFITVVIRDIKHRAVTQPAVNVTYDSIIDKLKDLVTTPQSVPVITATQQPKDDFFDLTLPAGFSLKDKGLTMKDVSADPHNVKSIYELTEAQKWALVTSRVSKRPSFLCYSPNNGTFSQYYALKELVKRSFAGQEIMKLELTQLQAIYENEKKPSWEAYDEESSSSSEDDY